MLTYAGMAEVTATDPPQQTNTQMAMVVTMAHQLMDMVLAAMVVEVMAALGETKCLT